MKDKLNYELNKTFNSDDSAFLSRPIALRLWSSFFVILPIFIQAPWVRLEPISALCFTFIILFAAFVLYKKPSNKLTKEQAVRIALTLPNPKTRNPKKLKSYIAGRISRLKKDIDILKKDDRSSCFL